MKKIVLLLMILHLSSQSIVGYAKAEQNQSKVSVDIVSRDENTGESLLPYSDNENYPQTGEENYLFLTLVGIAIVGYYVYLYQKKNEKSISANRWQRVSRKNINQEE